jgi:hypothetical protein
MSAPIQKILTDSNGGNVLDFFGTPVTMYKLYYIVGGWNSGKSEPRQFGNVLTKNGVLCINNGQITQDDATTSIQSMLWYFDTTYDYSNSWEATPMPAKLAAIRSIKGSHLKFAGNNATEVVENSIGDYSDWGFIRSDGADWENSGPAGPPYGCYQISNWGILLKGGLSTFVTQPVGTKIDKFYKFAFIPADLPVSFLLDSKGYPVIDFMGAPVLTNKLYYIVTGCRKTDSRKPIGAINTQNAVVAVNNQNKNIVAAGTDLTSSLWYFDNLYASINVRMPNSLAALRTPDGFHLKFTGNGTVQACQNNDSDWSDWSFNRTPKTGWDGSTTFLPSDNTKSRIPFATYSLGNWGIRLKTAEDLSGFTTQAAPGGDDKFNQFAFVPANSSLMQYCTDFEGQVIYDCFVTPVSPDQNYVLLAGQISSFTTTRKVWGYQTNEALLALDSAGHCVRGVNIPDKNSIWKFCNSGDGRGISIRSDLGTYLAPVEFSVGQANAAYWWSFNRDYTIQNSYSSLLTPATGNSINLGPSGIHFKIVPVVDTSFAAYNSVKDYNGYPIKDYLGSPIFPDLPYFIVGGWSDSAYITQNLNGVKTNNALLYSHKDRSVKFTTSVTNVPNTNLHSPETEYFCNRWSFQNAPDSGTKISDAWGKHIKTGNGKLFMADANDIDWNAYYIFTRSSAQGFTLQTQESLPTVQTAFTYKIGNANQRITNTGIQAQSEPDSPYNQFTLIPVIPQGVPTQYLTTNKGEPVLDYWGFPVIRGKWYYILSSFSCCTKNYGGYVTSNAAMRCIVPNAPVCDVRKSDPRDFDERYLWFFDHYYDEGEALPENNYRIRNYWGAHLKRCPGRPCVAEVLNNSDRDTCQWSFEDANPNMIWAGFGCKRYKIFLQDGELHGREFDIIPRTNEFSERSMVLIPTGISTDMWFRKGTCTATWTADRYLENLASQTDIGNKMVRQIVLLGSHDAGMSCITNSTPFGNADNCQTLYSGWNFKKQLENGVRWFDLRPMIWDDGQFYAGHFSDTGSDKAGWQGATGESFASIIQAINNFTDTHNELIVLDMSSGTNPKFRLPSVSVSSKGIIDVGGASSMTITDWNNLYNYLTNTNTGIRKRWNNSMPFIWGDTATLNSFIKSNGSSYNSCVVIIWGNGESVHTNFPDIHYSSDEIPKRRTDNESIWYYNNYSGDARDNVDRIVTEQVKLMQQFGCGKRYFLLCWQATQTDAQSAITGIKMAFTLFGALGWIIYSFIADTVLKLSERMNSVINRLVDNSHIINPACYPSVVLMNAINESHIGMIHQMNINCGAVGSLSTKQKLLRLDGSVYKEGGYVPYVVPKPKI